MSGDRNSEALRKIRKRRVGKLEAIYASVPSIDCKGLCHDQCTLIPMTPIEAGRMSLPTVAPESIACPILKDGRCSQYRNRPLICRLFGVVEGMPCPHGCAAERVLSDRESHRLIAAVNEVGGREIVTTHGRRAF